MKNSFIVLLLLFTLVPQSSNAEKCRVGKPYPFESQQDLKECPPPIQGWMDRANGCAHLQGEIGDTSTERTSELEEEWAELQCDYIGCDYDEIYHRYEADLTLTGILSAYSDYLYGDAGVPSCQEQPESVAPAQ